MNSLKEGMAPALRGFMVNQLHDWDTTSGLHRLYLIMGYRWDTRLWLLFEFILPRVPKERFLRWNQ